MMPLPQEGQRVLVTLPYAGLRAMQVCVVKDVTDDEILAVCNKENPQLVTGGWHTVVRTEADLDGVDNAALPGQCVEYPDRQHMIVLCL
jgi:hypothetical protein